MESFDELMKAWDGAIRELTRASVIVENAIDLASEREVPDILCSCLTQDCLGRGKTIKEGGAVYDFISGLQVGIANMADSLSAIKKLVYEEKKISRDELMNALAADFAGEEYENKPSYEPVLSHGDFCLPNIYLDNGIISGFIDLGDAGIGDKWRDIALCYRSLKHNAEGAYGGKVYPDTDPMQLFKKLQIEPDWDKIRFYLLMDELF